MDEEFKDLSNRIIFFETFLLMIHKVLIKPPPFCVGAKLVFSQQARVTAPMYRPPHCTVLSFAFRCVHALWTGHLSDVFFLLFTKLCHPSIGRPRGTVLEGRKHWDIEKMNDAMYCLIDIWGIRLLYDIN